MVLASLTQVTVTLVFAFITRLVQLYKPRYPRFFQFAFVVLDFWYCSVFLTKVLVI